jgi:2,4-dienoyl-CoA reductase-like NADH-dependent reductase (Old Yellow Enzyme family)/thioredoxin reductase
VQTYYRQRAKGGIGAIIVEPLFIDPVGKEHPKQLGISTFDHIKGLKNLVDIIHEEGTLAIAHLNHAGRAANPKASGTQPEAPSEVTCPTSGATPCAMSIDRINKVILEYAGAVRRAIEVGFDAVEIQFGLGYLIAQFLSSRTNLRTDEYGGSRNNRFLFATEVLSAVRQETGGAFPILARISATEQVDGGLGFSDAVDLAHLLEEQGIVALHVASGSACDSPPWYYQHMRLPLGKNLEWAQGIKKEVNIPVIVAGRLGNPAEIRAALRDGLVDAIALGRPLVADPDFPLKMREKRDAEIIQCGACLQGCLAKVISGEGLGCIVNPEVGREWEQFSKPGQAKTVVVVGGGPAGMQAALTAAERGHKVVLFDKGELGGQFNLLFLPPGKEMMERPLSTFIHRVKNSSVNLRLLENATPTNILAETPDVVIIATGASPIVPRIPGLDTMLTVVDILTKKEEVGHRVLVIGGGMVGLECAEFLAKDNHEITVVKRTENVALDMIPITRKLTLNALESAEVKILTKIHVTRFDGQRAFIKTDMQEELLGEFDSVVVTMGMQPENDLVPLLSDKGIEVKVIGDAKKPRQIYDAVHDGFEAAISI